MTAALQFANAPKKSANLSLNSKVLETAKELGMNLSKTVDGLLADEVKRRYWEKWRDDNQEAFAAHNQLIREHGLPLAKYRTWGKSLGDGRVLPPQRKKSPPPEKALENGSI